MKRKHISGQDFTLQKKETETELKKRGILNMNACISYVEPEDEYLTLDSVRFHEHMGYQKVAHFHPLPYALCYTHNILYAGAAIVKINSAKTVPARALSAT